MTPALPGVGLAAALLLAAGAAVGGVTRWVVTAHLARDFPHGVMAVNVTGSFLLGVLVFGGVANGWVGPHVRLFLGVGVLGAFTTMSAFAFDTVAYLEVGDYKRAAVNVLVNPVLCLLAVLAARALALPATG